MELRLAGDDDKESAGTSSRLSGEVSEQSEGIREENNPWDYENDKVPYTVSTSAVATGDLYTKTKQSNNNIILNIGMILVYLCVIFEVASIAWICIQEPSEIYVNLMKMQWFYSLCSAIIFIDAILVNVLYERKISLIVIAWLLSFLYPAKRNKHISGTSGLGGLYSLAMVVATLALMAQAVQVTTSYGDVIQIKDEEVRKTAVMVLDQTTENGQTIADMMKDDIYIENAYLNTDGTQMALTGKGKIEMDGQIFVDTGNKSIETELIFVKTQGGTYEIAQASLGGVRLSEYGTISYWKGIILD